MLPQLLDPPLLLLWGTYTLLTSIPLTHAWQAYGLHLNAHLNTC